MSLLTVFKLHLPLHEASVVMNVLSLLVPLAFKSALSEIHRVEAVLFG